MNSLLPLPLPRPRGRGLVLGAAGAVLGWRLARRGWPLTRVVVADDSMRPALLPGDRLLVLRWAAPRPGDVVVAHDPTRADRLLVKRAAYATTAGWTLLGDNVARSRDSRHFGPLPRAAIVGRAVWRYLPAERRGRL